MKKSHRRMLSRNLGLTLFLLLLGSPNLSALEVPTLRGRVNDLAGLMAPTRVRDLEERLKRFEEESGHQIAVLTIPSLEGENLEAFSIKVAETWKIGQKGFDNGAILLIARNDRKLRIEVGYGLEGVLPDALASRIIREIITPYFRSNDYPGGIEAGIEAIMKATRGEPLPVQARRRSDQTSTPPVPVWLFWLLFTSAAALFMGACADEALRSDTRSELQMRFLGAAFGGATSAALGIFALATGFGLGLWIFMAFVGSIMGAIGSRMGFEELGEWSAAGGSGYSGGGSFEGGGGGGFSGGGGGFGGGGASGSW